MLEFKAASCSKPGRHQRRLGDQQRHGLPLHVRAHQRAVGVVVFEEGDQAGRHADHLRRRHVDVLHLIAGNQLEIALVAGDDRVADQLAVLNDGVGRGDDRFLFLVGAEPLGRLGQLAILELLVRRDEETVFVDAGVDGQAGDQADVRAFGGFDRANSAVVRIVHVADLEARPLAVQAARAQGRKPPLVREHRKRIRLIDDLRKLAAAEEILDRRRNALRIDQAPRRHVFQVFQAHPFLDRSPQLEEALAQLVGAELVDRPQPAVAQVVDVVDFRVRLAVAQLHQIADRGDQVVGAKGHFRLGDVQPELAVDAEAADAAQTVAVGVVELLVEQGPRLLQLRRIAGPQPLINPQQRLFVAGRVVVGQGVQQQRGLRVGHHLDLLQARRADRLGDVLRDLLRTLDQHLAGAGAVGGIDDVADGQLALDLRRAAAVGDLDDLGLEEHSQQVGVVAVLRIHRPQQRHDRELAALVDANRQAFLAVDVQLDPASAFGDDAAALQAALAGALHFADEIDAGAAVKLADHHALGPVDDELAAAEHDRDVAEVDLLLDRLLLGQAEPHLERPAVGQAQLPALVGLVAGLAQLVADVLQPQRLVVAFDGKDFAQHALDPVILPLLPREYRTAERLRSCEFGFPSDRG